MSNIKALSLILAVTLLTGCGGYVRVADSEDIKIALAKCDHLNGDNTISFFTYGVANNNASSMHVTCGDGSTIIYSIKGN